MPTNMGVNSLHQNALMQVGSLTTGSAINVTASTITLTQIDHANRLVTLDRAAGVTVTLPAATGTGDIYRILTKTTVTSNNNIVKVANATDVFDLSHAILQDSTTSASALVMYSSTAGDDTVTMNGTTKGGYAGALVEVVDYAAGFFRVTVTGKASGTVATPFSATVS